MNSKTDIDIICQEHGVFHQIPGNHLKGSGCPLCVKLWRSKGVCSIEDYLTKNGITFKREKTFKELRSTKKNNQRLRFDFFLPKHKTLIEFDGEQHFKPVKIWGGDKGYADLIFNDKIKNKWAFDNGFRLIRISFMQKDEIEEILSNSLTL